MKVNVRSEFGELKEVVLGRPLDPSDPIWEWTPGMDEEFSWMKPDSFRALKEGAGRPWSEAMPEIYEKINEQLANYVSIVEDHGVTVHQPPHVESRDQDYVNPGIEQAWPRDVWCTAGDIVAIASLRMPWKRKQQFTMLPFYTEKMAAGECRLVSAPQASTDILSERTQEVEGENVLLDGGDFLVNGDEIYLGQGHGSNALGAKFAESVWGDEFEIYPLELAPSSLHLDCTMSLVRPGLGVICREWLRSELPPSIADWEWIETTEEEAAWLGVNGLPLDPETYMIDSSQQRIIGELKQRGVNVIELPYDGPSYLGGSLRCASQPINRAE